MITHKQQHTTQDNKDFSDTIISILSLLKISLGMYSGSDFQRMHKDSSKNNKASKTNKTIHDMSANLHKDSSAVARALPRIGHWGWDSPSGSHSLIIEIALYIRKHTTCPLYLHSFDLALDGIRSRTKLRA